MIYLELLVIEKIILTCTPDRLLTPKVKFLCLSYNISQSFAIGGVDFALCINMINDKELNVTLAFEARCQCHPANVLKS